MHLSLWRIWASVWESETEVTSAAEELQKYCFQQMWRDYTWEFSIQCCKRRPVFKLVWTETIGEKCCPLSLVSCFYCQWHASNILCVSQRFRTMQVWLLPLELQIYYCIRLWFGLMWWFFVFVTHILENVSPDPLASPTCARKERERRTSD